MIRTWLITLVLLVPGLTSVGAPAHAANDTDWVTVAAGVTHTCGIRAGKLFCWGYDGDGKLGNGADSGDQDAPQQIGTKTDWKSIAAGDAHTCGIRVGKLFCWGYDGEGRLGTVGDGDSGNQVSPQRIGAKTDWTSITAGQSHTCGVRAGKLFCWGSALNGRLGNGNGNGEVHSPERIGLKADWTRVSAGDYHTCGIRAGRLFCWGSDYNGEVGNGDDEGDDEPVEYEEPQRIGVMADWTRVATGDLHTCGIRAGKLFCWGDDDFGQLGNGAEAGQKAPQRIGTETDWKSTTAGDIHTCGVRSVGSLFCWGADGDAQLGNGAVTGNQVVPQPIGADTGWKNVTGGGYHTCATLAPGELFCWGGDYEGQLGNGPDDDSQNAPDQI